MGILPVNLMHIFITPLPRNTSGWLLLFSLVCITLGIKLRVVLTLMKFNLQMGPLKAFSCWYIFLVLSVEHLSQNSFHVKNRIRDFVFSFIFTTGAVWLLQHIFHLHKIK